MKVRALEMDPIYNFEDMVARPACNEYGEYDGWLHEYEDWEVFNYFTQLDRINDVFPHSKNIDRRLRLNTVSIGVELDVSVKRLCLDEAEMSALEQMVSGVRFTRIRSGELIDIDRFIPLSLRDIQTIFRHTY